MPSNRMSDKGMDLLMSIESFRDKPYDDQNGNAISNWVKGATIGYGHLINQDEWNRSGGDYQNGITEARAQTLFMQDLSPFVDGVNARVTAALSQNQFDALVILAFNIGLGNFTGSSVLKLVNDPAAQTNYPDLESAWKSWNKSQGEVMQGLTNRRNAEWAIYSQNVYARW